MPIAVPIKGRPGKFRGAIILSQEGREYQKEVGLWLAKQGRPHVLGRIAIHLTVHAPDRRKRDILNFDKAVLDACTMGGLWDDDSQIDEAFVVRGLPRPNGELHLAAWTIGELQRSLWEESAVVR